MVNVNYEMKTLKKYFITTILAMFFVCIFAGIKVHAATPPRVTGLKQTDNRPWAFDISWDNMGELNQKYSYEVYVSNTPDNWGEPYKCTDFEDMYVNNCHAGRTYYVRVRAYCSVYNNTTQKYETTYGDYSSTLECATGPDGDVANLKKTDSTTTSMTLQWDAVAGANAYVVLYCPQYKYDEKKTVMVTGTNTKLTGLKKNTSYGLKVYPVNCSNTGYQAWSGIGLFEIYTLPQFGVTPTKITGAKVTTVWTGSRQIDVTYKKSDSAAGYAIEVWTANKKKDTKLASTTSTGNKVTVKKNIFRRYNMIKVRVRAYTTNSNGKKKWGEWSSWAYGCKSPSIKKATSTSKGIKLTWDKISGANRYVIYASTREHSGYKKVKATSKTSYTVTKINKKKLKKGKSYYFYIIAQKKVGSKYYSGNSEEIKKIKYSPK